MSTTGHCNKSNLDFVFHKNTAKKAVFIFHGYGASMNDLSGLAPYLDQESDFDWFFPNGHLGVDIGMHVEGRAWFPIDMAEMQRSMMSGVPRVYADKYPEGLDEALSRAESFIVEQSANYDEIIIGGFSQGSMVTSHLLHKFAKLKGFICFSGTLAAQESLETKLEGASGLQFFQSHGKSDPVLDFAQAMNLFELLKLYRLNGEFVRFDGGHEIPMIVIEKCQKFLKQLA